MTEQKRNEQRAVWISLLLGLVTLALYLPALRHEFLTYDDQQYVTENRQVQAGLTGQNLIWAFGFHAGNWHPLTWISHMVDCQLFGVNPGGHHLTSILIHVATTILLFIALRRLTGAVGPSGVVAALFAWHPLHVESVAWIAERKDLLSAFFWVLSIATYAGYASKAKDTTSARTLRAALISKRYLMALGSFALALMSKPMAVTLPFVLLLLDFWPLQRSVKLIGENKSRWRKLIIEKLPFFGLSAATCLLTIAAQEPAIVSTASLPIGQRVTHAIISYAHYLGATFLPTNLAIYYPYNIAESMRSMGAAGALLALVTGAVLKLKREAPYLLVGWLWFLGTLVPVIGLVQVGDQAWADRYTYLPSIGLFVAAVWGVRNSIENKVAIQTLTILPAALLLTLTTRQLGHWKNTETLFTQAANVTQQNHMAITMLGSVRAKEGRLDEAIKYYETALRYKPGYPEAHFFLGNALDRQGKLEDAITHYQKSLWFRPTQEPAHIFLGIALSKLQRLGEAETNYVAALKINPDSAVAHNNYARLLHTQSRWDEAIEHYLRALQIDPELAQAHNNLGILLLQQGQLTQGTDHLRKATRLSPQNPESSYNLALALNQQEAWAEAIPLFAKTVTGATTDPKAHYQFGLALRHSWRIQEAMAQYASALLLQPEFPEALAELAWMLATTPSPGASQWS